MASKRKADEGGGAAADPPKMARAGTAVACVAIDFGTRGTGIALAFLDRPDKITTKQPGGNNHDEKALTCVLLDDAGAFRMFGVQARDHFMNAPNRACSTSPVRCDVTRIQ